MRSMAPMPDIVERADGWAVAHLHILARRRGRGAAAGASGYPAACTRLRAVLPDRGLSLGARADARIRAFPGCDRAAERVGRGAADRLFAPRHTVTREVGDPGVSRYRRAQPGDRNRMGIRGGTRG